MLFEPTERKSLASVSTTLHHVILNELDNVRSRVFILTKQQDDWKRERDAGPARIRHRQRLGRRSRRIGRIFPHHRRLPDARRRLTMARSGRASRNAQADARRSSTPRGWSSASTRRLRRTARGFRTSRCRARTSSSTVRTRRCSTATAASRSRWRRATAATIGAAWLEKGGRLRGRQHSRRRRVRPALAPGRPQGKPPQGLRGFHRRRRGPHQPQGHLAAAPGHHGRQQRRPAHGQHAHACGPNCSARSSARCRCST